MAVVATMNASLARSGTIGGSETITVPTVTASTALEFSQTVNLPAGSTSLSAIIGAGTLTGITGMWLAPAAGTTASSVGWGATPAGGIIVGAFPTPVHLSGGFTISGVGVCLSAATTVQIVIY